jgi:hypothetical protein
VDYVIHFLINWGSKGLLDTLTEILSNEQISLEVRSNDSQSHDLENRIRDLEKEVAEKERIILEKDKEITQHLITIRNLEADVIVKDCLQYGK